MAFLSDNDKSKDNLINSRRKEAEELVKGLAVDYGLPYINLFAFPINLDGLRIIDRKVAEEAKLGVFNLINKRAFVAVLSPQHPETQKAIADIQAKGYDVSVSMTSEDGLKKIWARYDDLSTTQASVAGTISISNEAITELREKIKSLNDAVNFFSELASSKDMNQISRILEVMLAGALALKVSDLHLEPEEDFVRLRYRLDGLLTEVTSFDYRVYRHILARLKLVSGMKLNLSLAQDGRFSIKAGNDNIEIRESVIPSGYGESVVMRVLDPRSINVKLEDLGIHPRLLDIFKKELSKPNGMLLNTGPTGSGKTTSLYAFLKYVYTPDTKILTIENPIEYHLEGIVQTQTDEKKGYNFLAGLRAALRQDPDIIMVGEIRDKETAGVAINAALTGHLVLSTLHTNNAAGTYPRLIDLGINPKVIPSALTVSMAQRLTRKLCPHCKKEVPLEEKDKIIFSKIIESTHDKTYFDGIQKEVMWAPVGCDKCNAGYKGRIGLYEAILADENVEKAVNSNPSENEIWKAAAGQNILNMTQDAVLKILSGTTSLEDSRRVIEIE